MIVTFTFSRRIGYYLINFYVPCIIMVIMSWIVFWMDRDCIGDRIALGITTVLTIVFLLGSSNSTMPRVSYPKAIDWYLMTSFIFVFTTLIMCLLIFRFDRQLGKQQRPPRSVSGEPPAEAASMQVFMGFLVQGAVTIKSSLQDHRSPYPRVKSPLAKGGRRLDLWTILEWNKSTITVCYSHIFSYPRSRRFVAAFLTT